MCKHVDEAQQVPHLKLTLEAKETIAAGETQWPRLLLVLTTAISLFLKSLDAPKCMGL